ncbi:neurotrimin-like isoform X2 [Vespula squamosa]|uniref:Neurotrimin-like isoform X2 n=1 Tax=Vespula squamosa TaxID=30214 RepID=A0ABD2B6Z0_VESSQ
MYDLNFVLAVFSTCDVNIIGPSIDFDSYYLSLNFVLAVFVKFCIGGLWLLARTSVYHRKASQPTSMTYLIFNQLQIIHPQFRSKSRTSVLEPSQNFLNRHEAKKRLYIEEAPTNRGSRGQLLGY